MVPHFQQQTDIFLGKEYNNVKPYNIGILRKGTIALLTALKGFRELHHSKRFREAIELEIKVDRVLKSYNERRDKDE